MAKGDTLAELLAQRAELDEKIKSMADGERERLLSQLAALDEVAPKPKPVKSGKGNRGTPRAKYRSKANPELTWSGRGQMARWLVAEMDETGLEKDAFLIDD